MYLYHNLEREILVHNYKNLTSLRGMTLRNSQALLPRCCVVYPESKGWFILGGGQGQQKWLKNSIPLVAIAVTVWTPPPVAMIPIFPIAVAVTIEYRTHSMTTLNDGKIWLIFFVAETVWARLFLRQYIHNVRAKGTQHKWMVKPAYKGQMVASSG